MKKAARWFSVAAITATGIEQIGRAVTRNIVAITPIARPVSVSPFALEFAPPNFVENQQQADNQAGGPDPEPGQSQQTIAKRGRTDPDCAQQQTNDVFAIHLLSQNGGNPLQRIRPASSRFAPARLPTDSV